jgi:hypothetical protein
VPPLTYCASTTLQRNDRLPSPRLMSLTRPWTGLADWPRRFVVVSACFVGISRRLSPLPFILVFVVVWLGLEWWSAPPASLLHRVGLNFLAVLAQSVTSPDDKLVLWHSTARSAILPAISELTQLYLSKFRMEPPPAAKAEKDPPLSGRRGERGVPDSRQGRGSSAGRKRGAVEKSPRDAPSSASRTRPTSSQMPRVPSACCGQRLPEGCNHVFVIMCVQARPVHAAKERNLKRRRTLCSPLRTGSRRKTFWWRCVWRRSLLCCCATMLDVSHPLIWTSYIPCSRSQIQSCWGGCPLTDAQGYRSRDVSFV